MSKLRKALQLFWLQTTTLGKEKISLAGQDHLGNKYYEVFRPNAERKVHRYFEKSKIENFDALVDAATDIPPCWDAWLRFRRETAPTKQEVEESEEYYRMQQKRAMAKKLEEQAKKEAKLLLEEQEQKHSIGVQRETLKPKRTIPPGYYDRAK